MKAIKTAHQRPKKTKKRPRQSSGPFNFRYVPCVKEANAGSLRGGYLTSIEPNFALYRGQISPPEAKH